MSQMLLTIPDHTRMAIEIIVESVVGELNGMLNNARWTALRLQVSSFTWSNLISGREMLREKLKGRLMTFNKLVQKILRRTNVDHH